MEQITIKEIASLCGVGVSTVSRAINNHPDINQETKTRILETIREYNYIPNNSARNLKRAESNSIAVLVKGISNPFFGPMIGMLERAVIRNKYTFVLQQVEEHEDEIEVAIQLEKEKRLKGLVFLGGMYRHNDALLRLLTVPSVICTVNMLLPEKKANCSVVSIDDEEESCRMVRYLIDRGHRRIAILSAASGDTSIGSQRLQGYRRALEEEGIPFDPKLVVPMREDLATYTIENGYHMTRELLSSGKDFTCIFAISDTLAIGACKAVFDAGLRVPEDVSVAGFDGLDIAAYYVPSVTTIAQPREEMALEAIRLLMDMIHHESGGERLIFQASLREGQSVKPLQRNGSKEKK